MLQSMIYGQLILWISFAFCLSLTAGGILVAFRVGQIRQFAGLQYLQYFLVLMYVFGYYSLWSRILLPRFVDVENVDRLMSIVSQMGVPFFIISLIMLLIWAIKTQDKLPEWLLPATLSAGIVTASALLLLSQPQVELVRAAYSIAGFLVSVLVICIFVAGRSSILERKWVVRLITLTASAGLIHLTAFTRLVRYESYEVVFVFLFFLFNTAVVVLFIYTARVGQSSESFDEFILSHGITSRESDVIQGIYDGKTNQEIADQLFITLQTVKDHSSRIYQKTRVKNRAQLMALLRDSQR